MNPVAPGITLIECYHFSTEIWQVCPTDNCHAANPGFTLLTSQRTTTAIDLHNVPMSGSAVFESVTSRLVVQVLSTNKSSSLTSKTIQAPLFCILDRFSCVLLRTQGKFQAQFVLHRNWPGPRSLPCNITPQCFFFLFASRASKIFSGISTLVLSKPYTLAIS